VIDTLRQDVRFALRSLWRSRGATAVAGLSFALGIAANATVFSLVQAIEFPRLIYPEASRIVFLESNNAARGVNGMLVSAPDGLDITAASKTLTGFALTADQTSVLREGTPPARVSGRRVTPEFFEVLRVPPMFGRVLRTDDEAGTLVVSHGLWRDAFGSDPSIVGRTIHFDGGTVVVAGVMPAGFDTDAEFWAPFDPTRGFARDDRQLTMFARLTPEASVGTTTRELENISRRLEAEHPTTNRDWTITPVLLTRMHGRDSRGAVLMLQGAVLFVLLIACANIANLLLARATRRKHEMAVRLSLGASRGRLVRGLLVESLILAAAGGGLGVLLSLWGIQFAGIYGDLPAFVSPSLNLVVLVFSALLAVATGIASGILPALRSAGVPPASALRHDDNRAGGSLGWVRTTLVVVQIACALMLATGAALLVRSLINRQQVDLGYDPRGALRADLALQAEQYRDPERARMTVDAVLDRLGRAADVEAAGAITWALPTGAGGQRQLTLPGQRDAVLPGGVRRGIEAITPGYFSALGAPMISGRPFTAQDGRGATPVAIVNAELARHLWPNRSPIGELLRLGTPDEAAPVVTVVGVAGTVRRSSMHDVPSARVYVPFAQHPNASVTLVVRSRGNVRAAERELQAAIAGADPALFAEGVRTVEADVARFVAPLRMIGALLGTFGALGLLLAALGVFGTMSYLVSQRQRELAVRAALGARRRDIFTLVYSGALRVTVAGLVAGLALAVISTRTLGSFLYGVSATDPLTFAAVAVAIAAAALGACWRPARVAASADPMTVLRQ
jgi:putative ABC transport system permease protein